MYLGRVTFALIVTAALLCTPELMCLLPGAQLTVSEEECCRKMAGDCDHTPLPTTHSCCTSASPGAATAVKSPERRIRVDAAVIHFENQQPNALVLPTETRNVRLDSSPPPGPPSLTNAILRI